MNVNSVQCDGHRVCCWWDCCGCEYPVRCRAAIGFGMWWILMTGNASCHMYDRSCDSAYVHMCSVSKHMLDEHTCRHASSYVQFNFLRLVCALATRGYVVRTYMLYACAFVWHCLHVDPYVCPTRLETRTKEFNVCASLQQRSINAQYM